MYYTYVVKADCKYKGLTKRRDIEKMHQISGKAGSNCRMIPHGVPRFLYFGPVGPLQNDNCGLQRYILAYLHNKRI
jgi:hypothetical protein